MVLIAFLGAFSSTRFCLITAGLYPIAHKSLMKILQTLAVLFISASAHAQGDDCANGVPVSGTGSWSFDTSLATVSGFSGGAICSDLSSQDMGPDQFFEWTANAAGTWQIDTCGSSFDTKLSAHLGSGCGATCEEHNDDGFCGSFNSELVLAGVNAGDTFLIQVGGWNGAAGPGTLNSLNLAPVGAGDDCSSAGVIGGYGSWAFDTSSASASGFNGSSGCADTGSIDLGLDLFYQYTAAVSGDFEVSLGNSDPNYDTKLSVHAGSGCAATCLAFNDDYYGLHSSVVIVGAIAGETFLFQIGGWSGSFGAGTLEVLAYTDPCASFSDDYLEENDTPGAAAPLGPGTHSDLNVHINDSDFYSFTLQPGDILDVAITAFSDDLDLSEYDGAGNWVADWDTDSLTHSNVTGAVETWIVEVRDDPAFGADCSAYDLIVGVVQNPCLSTADDSFEDNDTCATAVPITDGLYLGLMVFEGVDLDMFSLTVPAGATLHVTAYNPGGCAAADVDMFLYDVAAGFCQDDPAVDAANTGELASAWTCLDYEFLSWTNTTGLGVDCLLRVSVWPQAPLNGCQGYDLTISGIGGGPDLFCEPAEVNSAGTAVSLGTSSFSGPLAFHLDALGGPVNQFGYFLVSAAKMDPGVSVSDGKFCLTAPLGRYGPNAGASLNSLGRFDGAGIFQNLAGTSASGSGFDVPSTLPAPAGGMILAGSTWHFQLWYRDGVRSNFSNGISVFF